MTSSLPKLLLLACAPVLLAAGEGDRCVSSLLPSALSPCTYADLDGDRHTDLALTFRRSLTIQLSASQRPQILDLAAFPTASGVITRDIDGDRDNDLIVTAGFRNPVAVFLNDGAGRFTAGRLPSVVHFEAPAPELSSKPLPELPLANAASPAPALPPPAVQSAALPATQATPDPTEPHTLRRAVRPASARAP